MLKARQNWLFCILALATAVALAWPVFERFATGDTIRGEPVSPYWFAAFGVFAVAIVASMLLELPRRLHWLVLALQVAAVATMALIVNWAMMTTFLMIVAWQVGLITTWRRATVWAVAQTVAVVAALAQALDPDLCWVIAKAFALQLLVVFTAQAVRREAATAEKLARTNHELRSAQAVLAASVRDAERLRISRELHDAWGHELTALGLQLEIASHASDEGVVRQHVTQAKGLSKALLGKVRDVVSTLREAERDELDAALRKLAQSVPVPRIHVALTPSLRVTEDQAHALLRCAQEAVTNSVRHAQAQNLWLSVSQDAGGVRLLAEDDGSAQLQDLVPGSGLLGMRERIESLGGRLAAGARRESSGFSINAWLPPTGALPA
ncbi:sensor histidine kinase [Tsuneonella dongtanensis]|nr:histidine kinase [Tsuneonella dongtanensis]